VTDLTSSTPTVILIYSQPYETETITHSREVSIKKVTKLDLLHLSKNMRYNDRVGLYIDQTS